jgi:ribosomal protein S2
MATSLSQLTLRDLMDAGLHFGHQTKRWNPKMKKYIYDKRNGVHIVDITQSLELLDKALAFAKKTAEDGGKILFVGTKKQAQEVVKTAAEECGAFYMTNRWLGGTLTNAQTIRKSVRRMRQLQKTEAENGGALSPHKKEAAALRRELDKLQQNQTFMRLSRGMRKGGAQITHYGKKAISSFTSFTCSLFCFLLSIFCSLSFCFSLIFISSSFCFTCFICMFLCFLSSLFSLISFFLGFICSSFSSTCILSGIS